MGNGYEKISKIVNCVTENEFENIKNYEEKWFIDNDIKCNKIYKNTGKLYGLISEKLPKEQLELFNEFDSEMNLLEVELCKFYFMKGLIAAFSNLNFLSDIKDIHHLIKVIDSKRKDIS